MPRNCRYFFLVLVKSGETWVPSSKPYPANITVTNLVKVTVETSIPSVSILFDGASYQTDTTGKLEIETVRGLHTFQVPTFAYLNNVSRVHFLRWGDSTNDPSKKVALDNDTTLNRHIFKAILRERKLTLRYDRRNRVV